MLDERLWRVARSSASRKPQHFAVIALEVADRLDENHRVTSATNHALVGRGTELAQLRRFVHGVRDGPCGLLLRGEAGIGKTALWRSGIEAAERFGIRVLETRCVEAELPLALGGLCDLLDRAFEDAADGLSEPHRHALAVTLGLESPDEEPPERLVLPRGFVAFVRVLAASGPVLLAIDDVQWLDAPSQRIVAYACNRLAQAPVGILATHRGDGGDALGLRQALDDRFAEMRLPPLGEVALHHLVRTRLGVRIPRATMARVHVASGGNPMFALEFAQVAATADGPLPLPSSLEELIHDRVAALPASSSRCWQRRPQPSDRHSRVRAGHRRRRGTRPCSVGSRCAQPGLRRHCPLHASTTRFRRIRGRVTVDATGTPRTPRIVEHGLGGTRTPRRVVDLRPGCRCGATARRSGGARTVARRPRRRRQPSRNTRSA